MAVGKRPIGAVQRHVLWTMAAHHGGEWSKVSPWVWETISRTERIMESLRLRDLVTAIERYTTDHRGRKIRYTQYKITDEGRKAAGPVDTLPSR
jgi:hypothetical protein